MKTLNLFNPAAIGELYELDQLENDLVDKMAYAIRYYREGHAEYTKNVKGLNADEFLECLAFMEDLKRLAEDMATQDEGELLYSRRHDDLILNVSPFYKYLQKYDLNDRINKIKVVKGRMHDYLHSGNFTYCAGSYDVMDEWEFLFNQILKDHGK